MPEAVVAVMNAVREENAVDCRLVILQDVKNKALNTAEHIAFVSVVELDKNRLTRRKVKRIRRADCLCGGVEHAACRKRKLLVKLRRNRQPYTALTEADFRADGKVGFAGAVKRSCVL